jgi:hypothetical protein
MRGRRDGASVIARERWLTTTKRGLIMRIKLRLLAGGGAAALVVLTGCASTRGAAGAPSDHLEASGSALAPSVRVGEARVLDTRVNPLGPLDLALKDGAIAVSFARLGRAASEQIDPGSLEPRSTQIGEPLRDAPSPAATVQRIVLDGNRFLVCWTSGDVEWGHRVMAQMFNGADGSPRGGPVAISPSSADVIGMPRAITYDGNRVVALYAATAGSSFELVAVPIEDATPRRDAERSARAMVP